MRCPPNSAPGLTPRFFSQVAALSLLAILETNVAFSQKTHQEPPPTRAPATPTLRDAALESLLAERRSPEAFAEAVNHARKHGVSPQAILEARFLFAIDRRDDNAIIAMQADFLTASTGFRLEDSAICSVREDWLAIVEYVQALSALRAGDAKSFKSHITEAFWLSPAQAAAYAPHIESFQNREAMKSLRVDFHQPFHPLNGKPNQPISTLIVGQKALLLHFWSPWSTECEQSLPDFIATASALHDHHIAALSLVSDMPAHLPSEARETIQSHKPNENAGHWGADFSSRSLARTLRVRNLPCLVLVLPDGTVKFHGQPNDDAFWTALKSLDPTISRPAAKKTAPEP